VGGYADQVPIRDVRPCFFEQIKRFPIKKPHTGSVHDLQTGVMQGIDLILTQITETGSAILTMNMFRFNLRAQFQYHLLCCVLSQFHFVMHSSL
jgi:hypothetical protein